MKGSQLRRSTVVGSVALASVVLSAGNLWKTEKGWLNEEKFTPVGESQSFQVIQLSR